MVLGFGRVTANPIDTVTIPGYVGAIGMVACPGVRVSSNHSGQKKVILADMEEIVAWGANGVVTLLESYEVGIHKLQELPQLVQGQGMWWRHLPIRDMGIPSQEFEDHWAEEGELIRHALRIGERVIFHCYAGLGRTGMMAARILVEMGLEPEAAIAAVRAANKRRIQTVDQLEFVRSCEPLYKSL